MTIGEMIKKKRESLNLTLDDVGRVVGVSKATVSRWESGDIQKMRRDKIKALSDLLGMDPLCFLFTPEYLTPDERGLLEAYRAADDRARADALEMLKSHSQQ